jgi:long-subunit acyl-CoA synthetase (AMP-forming)
MKSFYRRFVETASRYPHHIAVELQPMQSSSAAGERYSYAELRRIAEHLGGWLQQSGIAAGSRCAILANNSPRWVAAYLGIMAAGGVAVPLDIAFKPEQVAKLLKDSGASLLFVDASHLETATSAWSDIDVEPAALGRVFVIDSQPSAAQNLDAVLAKPVQPLAPLNAAPDDLAVLLYTSGTTSDPKGVMLTHGNLNAEADAVFRSLQLGPTDAILGVLPLFHALA